MAEPALMPPPVALGPDVRTQAREWARKKIPASVKGKFFDWVKEKAQSTPPAWIGAVAVRRKMLAIIDLYPWPSSEALRAGAEKRMRRIVCGAAGEVSSQDAHDLIHDLLENTDALLD